MPKTQIAITTTQTTEVTVSARIRQMLKARLEEHLHLAKQIKELEGRKSRIQKEVDELFAKEGQAAALDAGTDIDGIRVKKVGGVTRTLDKEALMDACELTAEELEAFYDSKPKRPHIKISAPGERDDE